LAQNTPNRPLPQPLLIAQGLADDLVLPRFSRDFVPRALHAGQELEYRSYAGRDHLSIVAPDSPLTQELVQWTQDRFDRVPLSRVVTEETPNNRLQRTALSARAEPERYVG